MARRPRDILGSLDQAEEQIRQATDADALRAAQATLLPLLGLSLAMTAEIVGRDRFWVSRSRNRFMRNETQQSHGGRRQSLVHVDEELQLVKAAMMQPGVSWYEKESLRSALRKLLDAKSSSPVSDTTITNILNRVADKVLPGAKGTDLINLQPHFAMIWTHGARLAAKSKQRT